MGVIDENKVISITETKKADLKIDSQKKGVDLAKQIDKETPQTNEVEMVVENIPERSNNDDSSQAKEDTLP